MLGLVVCLPVDQPLTQAWLLGLHMFVPRVAYVCLDPVDSDFVGRGNLVKAFNAFLD